MTLEFLSFFFLLALFCYARFHFHFFHCSCLICFVPETVSSRIGIVGMDGNISPTLLSATRLVGSRPTDWLGPYPPIGEGDSGRKGGEKWGGCQNHNQSQYRGHPFSLAPSNPREEPDNEGPQMRLKELSGLKMAEGPVIRTFARGRWHCRRVVSDLAVACLISQSAGLSVGVLVDEIFAKGEKGGVSSSED